MAKSSCAGLFLTKPRFISIGRYRLYHFFCLVWPNQRRSTYRRRGPLSVTYDRHQASLPTAVMPDAWSSVQTSVVLQAAENTAILILNVEPRNCEY